jgi:hypothetical protein
MNNENDVIYSGDELEIIAMVAPSGRLGVEIFTATATHPQEPEAVIFVRDILTKFLVDNGYE